MKTSDLVLTYACRLRNFVCCTWVGSITAALFVVCMIAVLGYLLSLPLRSLTVPH